MLILASSSPIRKKILQDFGINFTQQSYYFDEDSILTKNPKSFAYQASRSKLDIALQNLTQDQTVLVADSVVSIGHILQRKPKNKEEAQEMLNAQSGKEIAIITAQILKSKNFEICDISQTIFHLKNFNPQDLEKYLNSNLWQNKAGGIMIEGFHSKYIIKQNGFFSTALGLSIEKFLPFFEII